MGIIGDGRFVEVTGEKTHELPPLLVKTVPDVKRMDKMMGIASDIIEQEDMVSMADEARGSIELGQMEDLRLDLQRQRLDMDRRRMDLALNLVEQYLGLL